MKFNSPNFVVYKEQSVDTQSSDWYQIDPGQIPKYFNVSSTSFSTKG